MIRLPPYTLVDLLHESAGAVVYRGYRNGDRAVVTVKLLAGDSGSGAIERLRNEYAILQSIDVPWVVRPIALEKHEGGIALVLQGLSGLPLNALLASHKLDVDRALQIGAELARALAAIHRAGIVHRDIKPANVIVDLDRKAVKLIDFGIATRLFTAGVAAAASGGLEGSLAYVSPEQTGRMERGADARSDLYSLGVTLYEMLVGAVPFASSDPAEVLHAHLARTPVPPSAVAPGVPAVVSNIVMKLLQKAPEARYQSAEGLLFDLGRCLSALGTQGTIEPFVLGSRDLRAEISAPQRLYGREADRALLLEAIERAAQGARELVLVEGPSGIGKSALIREIAPAVVARGGHLVSGKCDQKGRSAPYAPVVDALRELFGRIATGSEAERERLRNELSAALGSNAQLLSDLVPELAFVIGPHDHASEVEPAQAQNRLAVALGSALRVLAAPDHPLVVFLDDLQWADLGTAWLLRVLLCDEAASCLLLIGALREDELPEGHPFVTTLAALRERHAAITTLRLGPLGPAHLRRFVADTLGAQDEQVADLAEVLLARTGGNPFFAYRLVRALHEGSAIAFDPERNAFLTDRERLEAAWHGGSVVELLAGEIEKLPPETRRILVLAAAVGHLFDGRILSRVSGQPEAEIGAALQAAIREGHVLAVSGGPSIATAASGAGGHGVYRFAHDRLQQAALSLAGEPAQRKNALDIGWILLARADESGRDEDLFDAADHLNEGSSLIADPNERATLARTDLRAGRRARARAAFETAAKYFQAGVLLLDEGSFEHDHELSFDLHSELAECDASKGNEDAALRRLGRLDERARTRLEHARTATIRVGLYVLLGQFPKAVAAGTPALRAFGLELPENAEARRAALENVLARAKEELSARPPASRLSAPDMTDPEPLALERLLVALSVPAYFVDPALLGVVMIAWLDLVTERGHSDLSAMGYASYGFFLSFFPERQKDGYEIGKLALALNENKKNRALLCKVMETFAGNIAFLHEPLRSVLARFPAALQAGLESGDFVHAAYIYDHIVMLRIGIGDPLESVGEQARESLRWMERTNDLFSMTIQRIMQQVVKNLAGNTAGRTSLSDDTFDEQEIASLVGGEGFGNLAALYHTLRLIVLVVHGAWPDALAEALLAEDKSAFASGQFFFTELTFFAALARIRAGGESARQSPVLAQHIGHLGAWATLCPANYRQKHLLVLAELAAMAGDELRAMKLYDEAIQSARENELVRDEALASELSAEFHRERGRARIARAYATDAYRGYLAWGAAGKARDMQPITLTNTAGETVSALIDFSSVIRAAQAIASEIIPPRVIEKLMRIVASSAGAERGHLVLERQGGWVVTARIGAQQVETGLSIPLDAATDLAASVVRHVARTHEPVLLSDAARDSRFGLDSYVAVHQPKSIVCMSMMQKGRRIGVVYLENNAMRGAFGKDRIEPLRILLTQAAIALELGSLYERVEAAAEELRHANARLEGDVAKRTQELEQELRVRADAERERAVLAEEVMRVQEERILELSAPLLPITDDVLVMPLIGGVDAARASRVLQTALAGAGDWKARTVIIDITGVKSAGAELAVGLLRAARALRLLGTEAVITGVRAEVARALIEAGAKLGGLVTRSTLQAGITHAMRRRG